ncbi:hypothetical protein D3C78_1565040 [compost metagenome]
MRLVLFQQRSKAFYQLFALFKRRARPGRECGTSGFTSGGHIAAVGGVSLPQRLIVDRIGFAEFSTTALLPGAINKQCRM